MFFQSFTSITILYFFKSELKNRASNKNVIRQKRMERYLIKLFINMLS